MAAGKGDISPDGAPDQSNDGQKIHLCRYDRTKRRFTHRWTADHSHIRGKENHQPPKPAGDAVHQGPGFTDQKQCHGHPSGQDSSPFRRDSEQNLCTQTSAAQVSDIKGESAQGDGQDQKISQPRQHCIGQILPLFSGNDNHPPNIELSANIQQDGDQDHKSETGQQLLGKNRGLGKKSRTDGRSRHQKGRTQQHTPSLLALLQPFVHPFPIPFKKSATDKVTKSILAHQLSQTNHLQLPPSASSAPGFPFHSLIPRIRTGITTYITSVAAETIPESLKARAASEPAKIAVNPLKSCGYRSINCLKPPAGRTERTAIAKRERRKTFPQEETRINFRFISNLRLMMWVISSK